MRQSTPSSGTGQGGSLLSLNPPFFGRNFGVWGHSEFSPLRETHGFAQGSGSAEASRQRAAKARLAEELTFHSNIWQVINSDYRPVELGLAKPRSYARLSHPARRKKGSERRRIWGGRGAKHRPPGGPRMGADGGQGRASPMPRGSRVCCCSHQNIAARSHPRELRCTRGERGGGWRGGGHQMHMARSGKQPPSPRSPLAPAATPCCKALGTHSTLVAGGPKGAGPEAPTPPPPRALAEPRSCRDGATASPSAAGTRQLPLLGLGCQR